MVDISDILFIFLLLCDFLFWLFYLIRKWMFHICSHLPVSDNRIWAFWQLEKQKEVPFHFLCFDTELQLWLM